MGQMRRTIWGDRNNIDQFGTIGNQMKLFETIWKNCRKNSERLETIKNSLNQCGTILYNQKQFKKIFVELNSWGNVQRNTFQ